MEAFDKMYLNQVKTVTKYLFHLFMRSGHDFNSCVYDYMADSEIRAKMDQGNWSALNKGSKQLYNSVDFSSIPPSDNGYIDGILSDWMALVYVTLQWKYGMPSRQIVEAIPPETLANLYNPLHETSINNACEKIYHKFLEWELEEERALG